jgi:hypothetical protein
VKRQFALVVLLAGCAAVDAPEGVGPHGLPLAVAEDFDSPEALSAFTFSDVSAWAHGDGALELTGESDYSPPHRSPRSIALLSAHTFGDFVLEADLMQTGREYGHRDLCLFFGFQDPANFYYVHLATTPDPNAHNVFLVDDAPRRPLAPVAEKGVDWGTEVWHRVRLERIGGRIRVFFDDLEHALISVDDATHGAGRVGFGSFDDQGRIDAVRLYGRPAYADQAAASSFALFDPAASQTR